MDNAEVAAKAISELLSLAANIEMFSSIKEYIAAQTNMMLSVASNAIQQHDEERADHFSMIFSELAIAYLSHIIDSGSVQIMEILVQLLEGVPELSCKSQLKFWKALFNKLNKD